MSARVFVVVGAKGGVGASTTALQLVDELPTSGSRVLDDADLSGRRSHGIACEAVGQLDAGHVPGAPAVAVRGTRTLVELTRTYEEGFALQASDVEATVGRLPPDALIVVDAPQPFAATVRPFIARAAKIVVVTEPSVLGVAAAHAMLAAMERFGIPAQRIALVLDNPRGVAELRRSEIQGALKTPVISELPLRRDRTYGTAFKQLVSALAATPDFEPLAGLRQSTAKPIGDRREMPRAGNATEPEFRVRALGPVANGASASDPNISATNTRVSQLKTELHSVLLKRIDFLTAARAHTNAQKLAELRDQVNAIAEEFLAGRADVGSAEEASRIRREVIEEALGFGPIESLLHEPGITEVMVNGHANVYVERDGKIERSATQFIDDDQVRLVIERIIAPLGRRLDESSPMVDARLPDGSRVNAIIEPLSIDGPTLTIRRFGTKRLGVDELLALGSITPAIADFLRAAVEARLNIVVSGGTGSGKTTLLNALSSFIPREDRIVTIEDAAELRLDQPHVVRLESRPSNIDGKGAVRIRELVRNALRMRPDRIVVGECRGGEALDMLQAMNTGHDGSLTTIHANSTRDALARVETMVLMAGIDLPVRAIREQVAGAFDLVVQVSRLRDGSRRIVSVSEIAGMEGDIVTMQELVRYRQHGLDPQGKVIGEFETSGVQPLCLDRFEEQGVAFDAVLFNAGTPARRAGSSWLR